MAVTTEITDAIAEVVMENPPVNALTVAGWYEVANQVAAAGRRTDVHAVVLRAEGRGFNAGVDIKEMQATEGFDALVGNPPFLGGKRITGVFGTSYRDYLVEHIGNGKRGPVTERIQKEFFAYIGGDIPDRYGWFTPVYAERTATARKPALVHCLGYGSIFDPAYANTNPQTTALTFLQTVQYYGGTSADTTPANFPSYKCVYGTTTNRISAMQQAFTTIMQSGVQVSLIQ